MGALQTLLLLLLLHVFYLVFPFLVCVFQSKRRASTSILEQLSLLITNKFLQKFKFQLPIIWHQTDELDPDGVRASQEALEMLNNFLRSHAWVAGDQFTIADLSIAANASALNLIVPIDTNRYSLVAKWLSNVEQIPCYNAGRPGLIHAKSFFDDLLKR